MSNDFFDERFHFAPLWRGSFHRVCEEEVRAKADNRVWEIHKGDADKRRHLSSIHAHDVDDPRYRLNLSDGRIFFGEKFDRKMSKKELLEIRKKFEEQNQDWLKLPS